MTSLLRAHPLLRATAVLSLLTAAGCAALSSPSRRADVTPQQAAACRERTEQIYLQQNRADIYRADTYASNLRDSPYSAALLDGVPTRGLSNQFAHQQMYDDCVRASGTGTEASKPTP